MKKTFLLAFIWLAVVACDRKEEAAPQIKFETAIVSAERQSALKSAGEDFKIQLIELTDSRCPVNADCISAGSADIKFNVSDGTNQVNVSVLYSGADKTSGSQEFELGGKTYVLKVSEVLPYPEIFKTPKLEDYKVSVSVEKK